MTIFLGSNLACFLIHAAEFKLTHYSTDISENFKDGEDVILAWLELAMNNNWNI